MTFTLFSVAIIFLFVTIAAIEIYRANSRGYVKTLISLGSLLFSALFSLIISPILSGSATGLVMDLVVRPIREYKDMIRAYQSFDALIEAAVSGVLSAVVFVILFFIVKWIVSAIVSKILKSIVADANYSDNKVRSSFLEKNERLISTTLGVVCAVFITMVVTSPLMGALDVVGKGIRLAETGSSTVWEDAGIYEYEVDDLEKYSNDIVGNIFYECGGKFLFRASARTEIYGKTVYLMNEIDTIEEVLHNFLDVYPILRNPSDATPEGINSLNTLRKNVYKLNLTRGIIADYFSECSEAWLDGYLYFLIRKPTSRTPLEPLIDDVLNVCRYSDETNVQNNISTIIGVYVIMIETDIMSVSKMKPQEIMYALEDRGIIDELDAELKNNPTMLNIDSSALSVSLVKEYFKESGYGEVYDEFVENITQSIISIQQRGYSSAEERTTVMTSYMTKYLKTFDVQLPGKTIRDISGYVLKAFAGTTPTTEMVDSFFKE